MVKSTFGILGVLIGFGLVITKVYLKSSFAYGFTFVWMTFSAYLASYFQVQSLS